MDKYSVVTKKNKDKKCSDCGKDLDEDSNVPKCPEHGTKPFEEEVDDTKKENNKEE